MGTEERSEPGGRPGGSRIEILGLRLPEVERGDDLVRLIVEAAQNGCGGIAAGDVLVITSKVISKSAGHLVKVSGVQPSERALRIVEAVGGDPRLTQIILDHCDRVLLALPIRELERKRLIRLEELSEDPAAARIAMENNPALLLVERQGQIYTDAGLDFSNHPDGTGSLPPPDPNATARELRAAIQRAAGVPVAVLVSDTELCLAGGSMDVARGAAGMRVIDHGMGRVDRFGRPKFGGMDNLAQELVAAAAVLMGQASEGIPVVLIRGVRYVPSEEDGIESWITEPAEVRSFVVTVLRATIRALGLRAFLRALLADR